MEPLKGKYPKRERREFPRLKSAFVDYAPIGKVTSEEISSLTENVSAKGICIFVPKEIKRDTLLSLKIYLPDGRGAVKAKGKVVWTKASDFLSVGERRHYDLGIEFVEIDDNDRERICEYTAQHPDEILPL